jgi:colanic acid biosynthesis protein WcaH
MRLPLAEYKKILSSVPIVCIDCLVVNDKGEFLLVKRKNQPLKDEYWVPGGRLHKNERLADAVHRKMREELGVEVEIIRNVGFFEEFYDRTAEEASGGVHCISVVYLVRPLSYDIKLDNQSAGWAWFKDAPSRFKEYSHLGDWHRIANGT